MDLLLEFTFDTMEKEKTQKNLMIPPDFSGFVGSKDMFRFLQSILEYCQV